MRGTFGHPSGTGSGHLLHGMGSGAVQFYNVIGPLSRHFRVIALDEPGFGEVDNPKAAYDHEFYADWLNDTLTALDLRDFYLLGLLMGGGIGLGFASRHSHQIKKLVIIGGSGFSQTGEVIPFSLSLLRYPIIMVLRFTLPLEAMTAGDMAETLRDPSVLPEAYISYNTSVYRKPGAGHFLWRGLGKIVSPLSTEELQKIQSQHY